MPAPCVPPENIMLQEEIPHFANLANLEHTTVESELQLALNVPQENTQQNQPQTRPRLVTPAPPTLIRLLRAAQETIAPATRDIPDPAAIAAFAHRAHSKSSQGQRRAWHVAMARIRRQVQLSVFACQGTNRATGV